MEYEIPCLNLVERLPGLWEPWKPCSQAASHVGLRMCPADAPLYHLTALFPHLQVKFDNFLFAMMNLFHLHRHNSEKSVGDGIPVIRMYINGGGGLNYVSDHAKV